MKKLFLTLGLGLSLSAYSQIVVREAAKDSTVWYSKLTGLPKLVHFYGSETDNYTLYYKNLSYQYITDIKYISLGKKEGALDFFNILYQALETNKEINFELDGKLWFLRCSSNMANLSTSGANFFLTKKNLENILEALK
jgi:hypothetical protein